jgi:hypothetical protein
VWEDITKIVLRKIGCGGMDWINRHQDRDQWRAYVNTAMNLRVLYNIWKFLSKLIDRWFLYKDSAPWSQYVYWYTCSEIHANCFV